VKKGLFIILIAAITLNLSVACISADSRAMVDCDQLQSTSTKITVNEQAIQEEVIISGGFAYVPLRSVFEAAGCRVDWLGEEMTADIYYGEEKISFKAVSDDVIVKDGRMYVPIRQAAEALGLDVKWDDVNRSITISQPWDDVNRGVSFAAKLKYKMPKDRNYVVSPLSIKYAMAMAANGADEAARQEIIQALGIDELEQYNAEVKEYMQELEVKGEDDYYPVFEIANSLWLNRDYVTDGDFSEEFKSLITDNYGAVAEAVDTADAVAKINSWCDKSTHGKISQIIEDSDFLACIANAVYLKAGWVNTFDEDATSKDSFTDRDGNVSELDFMHQREHLAYYEDSDTGVKAVELPYVGGRLSMYIILDDKGDTEDIDSIFGKLETRLVEVSVPRFKVESGFNANEVLQSMGISKVFDRGSKVSQLAPMFNEAVNACGNSYISDVLHKAYIDVNESGTEAAAATAVMVANAMAAPEPEKVYEFKADRPFTYIIRDNGNGEILFMGEYAYAE
jgi:serpin B